MPFSTFTVLYNYHHYPFFFWHSELSVEVPSWHKPSCLWGSARVRGKSVVALTTCTEMWQLPIPLVFHWHKPAWPRLPSGMRWGPGAIPPRVREEGSQKICEHLTLTRNEWTRSGHFFDFHDFPNEVKKKLLKREHGAAATKTWPLQAPRELWDHVASGLEQRRLRKNANSPGGHVRLLVVATFPKNARAPCLHGGRTILTPSLPSILAKAPNNLCLFF